MVERIEAGRTIDDLAKAFAVSAQMVSKWSARYPREGWLGCRTGRAVAQRRQQAG
jgi:hypothetical protein